MQENEDRDSILIVRTAVAILVQSIMLEPFIARAGKGRMSSFSLVFCILMRWRSVPRRGWSSIAIPSGWYEVIRGPRLPSDQWPLALKRKGKGEGEHPLLVVSAHLVKVARLEVALQALGQEQSTTKTGLEEALKVAKEDVPKPVRPQQRIAEASARVARLEAENDPDAEPLLKVALKKARVQAQVCPVGERLDLCLQFIARVKK